MGNAKPRRQKGLVNVFLVVPYQVWQGDLETLKGLLESLRLEANVLFGYESAGVAEWKNISNAQCNLPVFPWVGLSTVKLLEAKYGASYLHYPVLPSGAQETSKFLRTVGAYVGVPEFVTERVIQK